MVYISHMRDLNFNKLTKKKRRNREIEPNASLDNFSNGQDIMPHVSQLLVLVRVVSGGMGERFFKNKSELCAM